MGQDNAKVQGPLFVVERPGLLCERSYPRLGDLGAPGLQGDADGHIHIFGGQKASFE